MQWKKNPLRRMARYGIRLLGDCVSNINMIHCSYQNHTPAASIRAIVFPKKCRVKTLSNTAVIILKPK